MPSLDEWPVSQELIWPGIQSVVCFLLSSFVNFFPEHDEREVEILHFEDFAR